jgi:hypothetical protein
MTGDEAPPAAPRGGTASSAGPMAFDTSVAHQARMYDYYLGGNDNYAAAEAGIRQFLDVGTGIPTAGNTHQVSQAIAPEPRVVYVDYDRCKSGCAHAR